MHKKLMLACMAIAAFAAFVIAPAASATTLTDSKGTLAVGASITALNEAGTKTKFTGGFGVECEEAHLKGTVTQNNGSVAKGEIPVGSATFKNKASTECSSALGATAVTVTSKLCLETVKGTDNLVVNGCLNAEGKPQNVVFDLKAAGVTCKYETASVSGTFTTPAAGTSTTAKVFEQEAKEVGGSFFCPDTGKLDMEFLTTTTDGTAVWIS